MIGTRARNNTTTVSYRGGKFPRSVTTQLTPDVCERLETFAKSRKMTVGYLLRLAIMNVLATPGLADAILDHPANLRITVAKAPRAFSED